jgi:hypothetical protein
LHEGGEEDERAGLAEAGLRVLDIGGHRRVAEGDERSIPIILKPSWAWFIEGLTLQ